MDEVSIGLNYPILKCWMKCGQQKRIPMFTGMRQAQILAGVLNRRTETVHCRELEHLNSEALIAYFEWLLTDIYPSQTVVLVMDNAAFHHSVELQAALTLFEERLMISLATSLFA